MRQKIGTIDKLHIVFYYKLDYFRRFLSGRSGRFQVTFKRCVVRLWITNMSSNVLDAQEKKAVSHSSAESETISLDAGLRMDGIPVLHMWESVLEDFAVRCCGKPYAPEWQASFVVSYI